MAEMQALAEIEEMEPLGQLRRAGFGRPRFQTALIETQQEIQKEEEKKGSPLTEEERKAVVQKKATEIRKIEAADEAALAKQRERQEAADRARRRREAATIPEFNFKWDAYQPKTFAIFPRTQGFIRNPPSPPKLFTGIASRLTGLSNLLAGKTGGPIQFGTRTVRSSDRRRVVARFQTIRLQFKNAAGQTKVIILPRQIPLANLPSTSFPSVAFPRISVPTITLKPFAPPRDLAKIPGEIKKIGNALRVIDNRTKWFNSLSSAERSAARRKGRGAVWTINWREFEPTTFGTRKKRRDTSFSNRNYFVAVTNALNKVDGYTSLALVPPHIRRDISRLQSLAQMSKAMFGTALQGLIVDGVGIVMGQFESSSKVIFNAIGALPGAITSQIRNQVNEIGSKIRLFSTNIGSGAKKFSSDVVGAANKFSANFIKNTKQFSSDQNEIMKIVLGDIQAALPLMFDYVTSGLKQDFEAINLFILDFVNGLTSAIIKDGADLQTSITQIVDGLSANVQANIGKLSGAVKGFVDRSIQNVRTLIALSIEDAKAAAKKLVADLERTIEGIKADFDAKVKQVVDDFQKQFTTLNTELQNQIAQVTAVREELERQVAEVLKLKEELTELTDKTSTRFKEVEAKIAAIQVRVPGVPKTIAERKKIFPPFFGLESTEGDGIGIMN